MIKDSQLNEGESFSQPEMEEIVEWIGTARHIAARKESEAALRQNQELFLAVIAQAPVGVYVVDESMCLQHVNNLAIPVFIHVNPLIGRDFSEVMHILWPVEIAEEILGHFRHTLETGEPFSAMRFTGQREDIGLELSYDWQLRRISLPSGTFGVACYFNDVTEQKRAEEKLRLTMLENEQALRAKDEFLAALSHELRTPLTPVLMIATALEGDLTLPPEVRDQLATMRRNVELEARLIDDLLDLTRISRGKLIIAPVAVDLHQIVEHTAEIVRSDGLGKQLRLVFKMEATRHHILADPARLQQVFWNVLKNAIKFTPTGGTITVRSRNDEKGWIVVSVEDTGIGIGPDALAHVFNAFEQGDIAGQHRYGGLGLGLAISRAIVEMHSGMICVESEGVGFGATFTIAFASIVAPAVRSSMNPFLRASASALRLLVVEDHEATRTVLTRLLTRIGHHVISVGTVGEAVVAFAEEAFDVVISDIGLPDGSGLDLMRTLQRERPIAGIALSGYGMEEDLRKTKEAGFFAHLVKPIKIEQLRQLLAQHVIAR